MPLSGPSVSEWKIIIALPLVCSHCWTVFLAEKVPSDQMRSAKVHGFFERLAITGGVPLDQHSPGP